VDRQFAWADDGFSGFGCDVGFSGVSRLNKPAGKFSANPTAKVPIWCGATRDRGFGSVVRPGRRGPDGLDASGDRACMLRRTVEEIATSVGRVAPGLAGPK
jgi:hypothetical protein